MAVSFVVDSQFNKDAQFKKVTFGADGKLIEAELNELQDIQNSRVQLLTKMTFGDRALYEGTYAVSAGKLVLTNEYIVVDGEIVFVPTTNFTVAIGDAIYLNKIETTMRYTDGIKKYGDLVSSTTVANNMLDARIGEETTRRVQITYQLTKVGTGTGTFVKICDIVDIGGGVPGVRKMTYTDSPMLNEVRGIMNSFGLGDVATDISGTNLNNLDATGFYRGTNLTNIPTGDSTYWYYIINLKSDTSNREQVAIISTSTGANRTFIRRQGGGTWGSWTEYAQYDSGGKIPAGNLPGATTAVQGAVQLVDSFQNTSLTQAPTANALKAGIDNIKGYGIGSVNSTLADGYDLNNVDNTGFYYAINALNRPIATNGYVLHQKLSTVYKAQIYIVVSTGDSYRRVNNNGAWTAWVQEETTTGAQARADSAQTGAINWARSFGLGSSANNSVLVDTDLNTLINSGFYRLAGSHANAPATSYAYGQVIVIRGYGDTIAQMLFPYNSTKLFYRQGNPPNVSGTGAWGAWQEVETATGSQAKVDTHKADYTSHHPYLVSAGTANTYALTPSPALGAYAKGVGFKVEINVDNTGASTINVSGLGAKAIKKGNGNDVGAGNLKTGSVYTLVYNGTNFILQGEGGSGNAVSADVLATKTFSNDSGDQTGSMPNNGALSFTPSTVNQTIPVGYYNGSGTVAGDADLVPANIKAGVSIFGVTGASQVADTNEATNPITAGTVLATKVGFVNGAKVTGTMVNNGALSFTPGTTNQTIAEGYYNGTGTVAGDPDLITANIRAGVTIFGVAGATNVVDTTEATKPISASEVLSGEVGFVNGVKITGTMPNNGVGGTVTPGTANQTKVAGYYSSDITITGDADLVSANIKAGANIFGVAGATNVVDTTEATAPISASEVLNGEVGFVNGAKITGTMPNNGAVTLTPGATAITIPAGYHNGSGTVATDADLVTGNIRAGVNIFGVAGKASVVDTITGTAVASEVLATKVAFVNGAQVTGTMANNGAGGTVTPGTTNQTKVAGYYSSDITILGDADLVAGNIAKDANIFGVQGTLERTTSTNKSDMISAVNAILAF